MAVVIPAIETVQMQELHREQEAARARVLELTEARAVAAYHADSDPKFDRSEVPKLSAEIRDLGNRIGAIDGELYRATMARREDVSHQVSQSKAFHETIAAALIARAERFTPEAEMMSTYQAATRRGVHLAPPPPAPIALEFEMFKRWAADALRLKIIRRDALPAWLQEAMS
ncbi:MAG: hypothetical protein IH609_11900 [Dehalococcoidia bacterium]|nr:hypothetical protein [Dehalococcoidia bacterium]